MSCHERLRRSQPARFSNMIILVLHSLDASGVAVPLVGSRRLAEASGVVRFEHPLGVSRRVDGDAHAGSDRLCCSLQPEGPTSTVLSAITLSNGPRGARVAEPARIPIRLANCKEDVVNTTVELIRGAANNLTVGVKLGAH